jgi:hypothetical protein
MSLVRNYDSLANKPCIDSGHVTNIYSENATVTLNSKVRNPSVSTKDREQYKYGPSLESGNESSQDHLEESDADSTSSIEVLNGARPVCEEDCKKTRTREAEPVEHVPRRIRDWESKLREKDELLCEKEKRLREWEEQLHREDKAIQTKIQDQNKEIWKLRESRKNLKKFSDELFDEDDQLHDLRKLLAEKESHIEILRQKVQMQDVQIRQVVQFSKAVQQEALAREESAALLVTRLRIDRDDIRKERENVRKGETERECYLTKKESWAQNILDDAKSNLAWIGRLLAFPEALNEPIRADQPHARSVGLGPPSDSGRGSCTSALQLASRFASGGPRSSSEYTTLEPPFGLPGDRFMGREIRSDSGYETHSQASDLPKTRSSSSYLKDPLPQSPDIPPKAPTPPPSRHRPPERLNHKDKKQQLRHPEKPP